MSFACNVITLDISSIGLSMVFVTIFVILRYLFASITNDERGKVEARFIFADAFLTAVVVIVIGVILEHATKEKGGNNIFVALIDNANSAAGLSSSPFGGSSESLQCNAINYLKNMIKETMTVYKMNYWASMAMGSLQYFSYSLNADFMFWLILSIQIGGISPFAGIASDWASHFKNSANLILNAAIMPLISQLYILALFSSQYIGIILPVVVFLRPFPIFKGFAHLLLSVLLTFAFVYPFMLYAESYIFKLENINAGSITSYTEDFNNFRVIFSDPVKMAAELSLGALTTSGDLKKSPAQLFIAENFILEKDGGIKYKYKNNVIVNYTELNKINAKVLVNVVFISTINLIAIVVSIRVLQIFFGDTTENLFEMFMRWV